MAEINRAVKIIRGPNVVAHLAGTIFLKPSPDKPAFVQVGGEIKEDETVLALLENMKMFNEIRAHMSGKIREILVENERPVLPGDVIMVIE
ncbi:biotin carboxyl carrier domain-containing protein [Candidatus Sumerlaeota bacterium]|nr:biotin carboxyl carrier domain-containing protein [Candidatus Sumerlaeota bacterium]MBI3736770.1 biotin carboxyl carrier domain-containing protein [Candidatus Sumerlaeota bacterium]